MLPFNLADMACLKYLIACHDRCNIEQSLYNETRRLKAFAPHVLPELAQIRRQLIDYTLLILTGAIRLPVAVATASTEAQRKRNIHRSPLLGLLYDHLVPSDFLYSLVLEAQQSSRLQNVFGPIVNQLFFDMRSRIVATQLMVEPIVVLNELFDVVTPQTSSAPIGGASEENTAAASSSVAAVSSATSTTTTMCRPICQMVGKLYNFYPKLVTDTPGLEIAHTSFLGPFLSLSVFVEENPRFMDGELTRRESIEDLAPGIQHELENMRCLLHTAFHSLLKNVESRNSVLMYVSALLKQNEKRTQLHADERTLARDGFMCNLLCVLQKLSMKIKLDRVDGMYPFHWDALINIEKETKLRFDEPEYKQWSQALRKLNFFRLE